MTVTSKIMGAAWGVGAARRVQPRPRPPPLPPPRRDDAPGQQGFTTMSGCAYDEQHLAEISLLGEWWTLPAAAPTRTGWRRRSWTRPSATARRWPRSSAWPHPRSLRFEDQRTTWFAATEESILEGRAVGAWPGAIVAQGGRRGDEPVQPSGRGRAGAARPGGGPPLPGTSPSASRTRCAA